MKTFWQPDRLAFKPVTLAICSPSRTVNRGTQSSSTESRQRNAHQPTASWGSSHSTIWRGTDARWLEAAGHPLEVRDCHSEDARSVHKLDEVMPIQVRRWDSVHDALLVFREVHRVIAIVCEPSGAEAFSSVSHGVLPTVWLSGRRSNKAYCRVADIQNLVFRLTIDTLWRQVVQVIRGDCHPEDLVVCAAHRSHCGGTARAWEAGNVLAGPPDDAAVFKATILVAPVDGEGVDSNS